jgi:hypothetical protein
MGPDQGAMRRWARYAKAGVRSDPRELRDWVISRLRNDGEGEKRAIVFLGPTRKLHYLNASQGFESNKFPQLDGGH